MPLACYPVPAGGRKRRRGGSPGPERSHSSPRPGINAHVLLYPVPPSSPVALTADVAGDVGQAEGELAAEITRIHAEINHVPPTYVHVVFSELPQDSVYIGGEPGEPLLIAGWARRGHPQEETTRLALELSRAASRTTGMPERRILVVIQDSPARSAVEAGQDLPDPGQEKEWLSRRES
ncbi:tautomerase family protein [Streptomyces sp. NPDC053427]|uniref:tautomerase family protein n=1 Tax=Streptomyces sp. NPDC053427 TaxID=3365701 RepID=UPI0037CE66AD